MKAKVSLSIKFYTFAGGEEVVSKTQIIGKNPKDDLAYTQQQILPKMILKMQLRGPDFSSVPSDSCLNPALHAPLLTVSVYKLHSTSVYDLQVLLETHVSAVVQWDRQDPKFCFEQFSSSERIHDLSSNLSFKE